MDRSPSREERLRGFQWARQSLRSDDREVIIHVIVKGISMKRVAKRMRCSPEATPMLLLRATRKLKTAFGRIENTGSLRPPIDAHVSEKLMEEGNCHGNE